MKRPLEIFLLLGVIGVTLVYAILYFSLNLARPNNAINNSLRQTIISNHLLRTIFRLHQIGDARFDYATDRQFGQLNIALYYQGDEMLEAATGEILAREFNRVMNKPRGLTFAEPIVLPNIDEVAHDEILSSLVKTYPPKSSVSDQTISLQIFVLKTYASSPTFAGVVLDAQNIFIFKDAIRNVSSAQWTAQNAEVSTILHEFAHLLGAEHVSVDNCILSAEVENLTVFNLPNTITDSYCPEDLDEVKRALSLSQS